MKMRIGKTAWLLGLLLVAGVIPACGPGKPAVDRSEEEKALRALDIAWSEAANRKDVDAVVSYMADDGETLPPTSLLPGARPPSRLPGQTCSAYPP